jgi:AAA domain
MENLQSHVIPTLPDFKGAPLVWLQTKPGTLDMTDLFDLNDDDFAVKCIREVLENRPFDLTLQLQHLEAGQRFNHFYFESRNLEKVFGTKNLCIGYPVVMADVAGLSLCAPLFLWQIQLEPDASNPDKWTVQRTESHAAQPNYPMFHLIDTLYGSELSERVSVMSEQKQITTRNIAEISDAVRLLLNLQEEGLPFSVQPLPKGEAALDAAQERRLCWSALVGIFPALPKITRTHAPIIIPDLPADDDWQHSLSLLPLDPSQRSVLRAVQQRATHVVEGASGTGKTYLLSALIINALAHGKKCLVVSKSINSLRRAQKFIVEKGFGDLSFILRDLTGDQLMLADMLRAAADAKSKDGPNPEVYQTVLQQVLREQRKLDDAWIRLHQPVFGDMNFSETAGSFLRANRIQGKELLLSHLSPADFTFTREEYLQIVEDIRSSEPLFARFPTLSHPLNRLRGAIFLEKNTPQALEWTVIQVKTLMEKATALHHRYITKTNDYAETLSDHYESYYSDLHRLSQRVREAIADGTNRFGPDFGKPLSVTEKIYGTLSDKYKLMVADKEQVGQAFETLRKTHALHRYFDFDFPPQFDTRDLPKISAMTEAFETALERWQQRIPSLVREDVRRLNARTIHKSLDFRDSVRDLEQELDDFLVEYNQTGVYDQPLRHEMLTIPKRQEFLESVIAGLEETQFSLRDFPDFYVWHKHWLSLQPASQKVVQALCKIKPRDWVAAFDSWYLHHYLQSQYAPSLLWDEATIDNFARSFNDLKNILPGHLSVYWQQRKNAALKKLKSSDPKAYKTWFGKDNRTLSAKEDIAELFKKHVEAVTETLPVLLVSPHVANDVIQHSNMLFDLVLVDEAHNISKQQCYSLFDQAKHIVVFGDSKQDMTPQAEDDFLEFCKTLGVATHTLEYQHQDSPEEWIDFNRIAFGTPFKRLPSGRQAKDVTLVANVEGRYDEHSRTNEAEARQIIDWLNLIEQTPAKTYPVVGIACSTVEQRDLIAGQLLRVRQRRAPGYERIQQLQLNGLGVYQFSELQGQHVDVLLISLVHGITDSVGSLTRHFHFWNSQEGINQLHVALTRATQKIFIAHSIPPGLYSVLAADKNFLGTCILSHLVTFGTSIQDGDNASARDQLNKMKVLLDYPSSLFSPTVFMEEVELALQPFFPPGSIRRNVKVAGMNVPLVIQTETKTVIPMFDGVFVKSGQPSYEWEQSLKNYFGRQQVQFVPIMSAQWWKGPRQEAKRLAALIEE